MYKKKKKLKKQKKKKKLLSFFKKTMTKGRLSCVINNKHVPSNESNMQPSGRKDLIARF